MSDEINFDMDRTKQEFAAAASEPAPVHRRSASIEIQDRLLEQHDMDVALLINARREYAALYRAVFALYTAGHWTSDRLVADVELMLWENVRVAASIPKGIAPTKLYKTDQPVGKYEDLP